MSDVRLNTDQPSVVLAHRPVDRLRFVLATLGIVVVVGLAALLRAAPDLLVSPIVFAAAVAAAAAPAMAAVQRLLQREGRIVANGVLAALLTYLLTWGLNLYLLGPAPEWLHSVVVDSAAGTETAPINLFLSTLIAFITVVGFNGLLWLRNIAWGGLVVAAVTAVMGPGVSVVGLLIAVLLGRAVAFGIRWGLGSVRHASSVDDVVNVLTAAGHPVRSLRGTSTTDGSQTYSAESHGGEQLTVVVLDQDRPMAGLVYQIHQWLRLRRPAQRRGFTSLQRVVEQRTLLSLAVADSGIATPRLALVRHVGPESVVFAYTDSGGRRLDELDPNELTKGLLEEIWDLVVELHQHQICHRSLSANAFVIDDSHAVQLTHLDAGQIAASELQCRLDDAELLVTLATLVGTHTAVHSARAALSDTGVGQLLPLLRPVVFSAETRAQLRRHKGLLTQLRDAIQAFQPAVQPSATVAWERLRPQTIVSSLGAIVAVYFLLGQFANRPFSELFAGISWGWAAVALVATCTTYVASAMGMAGFVPHQLSRVRLLLTQLAGSFVTLVTPASVGGVAVNTRFLQKSGIPAGLAVTSVAASQVVALGAFLLLVMLFGALSGSADSAHLPSSSVVATVLLGLALLALLVAVIPILRRFVISRVRPYLAEVGPQMLALRNEPAKIVVGVAGVFLLPLAGSVALWASVRAFEAVRPIDFATVAVVFLVGKSAAAVVPTPGGLGAMEAVLAGGLAAATGITGSVAFSAVILFRLLTFWLPIAPGWVAATWLQRHDAL